MGDLSFCGLYILLLCVIGGKQESKEAPDDLHLFLCDLRLSSLVYRGLSPFWAAVFVCAITTVVTMYLIGGPTKKTVVSILGTMLGVLCAGISAQLFSILSGITGYNVSEIETLMTLWNTNRIQVGGLLFSGLLISSMGAVMDVAMSVSSSMSEILKQNRG